MSRTTLAILSGILFATSYIPFPPWALLFCLVPLFCALKEIRSSLEAFKIAWITQFTFTLIGFHWISYTATEFGNLPAVAGVLILLVFSALAHLHIPIAIGLWTILRNRLWPEEKDSWRSYWVLLLIWNGFERIWPGMFPWHFGYPYLWAKLPIYHLADLIGFEGLSLLTLAINLVFYWIWINRDDLGRTIYQKVASVLFIFGLLNALGFMHGQMWKQTNRRINVSVVQANIGNFEKVSAERNSDVRLPILNKYLLMTSAALAKRPDTQLVMWPETAFPDRLDAPYLQGFYQQQLSAYVRTHRIRLLTGAFSEEPTTRTQFNAAFLLSPTGGLGGVYRKTILLAFGEYFPFSQYFPILKTWFPEVASFGRGFGPAVLQIGETRGGVQICYEGLFPDFSRALAEQGAEILLNITNDSWYGRFVEPYQHLYMTLARAIELRRPLIRSTNTGISTAILADGTILEQSPIETEWTGTFEVPYLENPPPTLFAVLGEYWTPLIFVIALILIVLLSMKHGKARLVGLVTPP